jgi:hypothetical protein
MSEAFRPISTRQASSLSRPFFMAIAALGILNALLSMTNLWPTPFVKLDARIGPEFTFVWVGILVWVAVKGRLSARALTALSVVYLLLVIGRYVDTTAPALFGRAINLYWDGWQMPRLLWVLSKKHSVWVSLACGLGLVVLLATVFYLIKWSLKVAAETAAPWVLKRPLAVAISAFLALFGVGNIAGVEATWPYMSKPVIPTYVTQGKVLFAALTQNSGASILPPSPPFVSDLKGLGGADFKLFFFESYGAVSFDKPELFATIEPQLREFEAELKSAGRHVASAFVTSTTFGGGTDLAHMAMMTGVDTRDPIRHDILLTTKVPTLARHFKSKGFEAFGFYPGLDWDWAEGVFYGYDNLIDGRALSYQGPTLGYWKIPDQFALARFHQLYPVTEKTPPRFVFYSSSSSHFPFQPVPPYQPSWSKVLEPVPFDVAQIAQLQNANTDWLNMAQSYAQMVRYNFQCLRGYFRLNHGRDFVMLLLGDHQPASNVTGEGASWDVPVHVIASRPELIARFVNAGFTPGLIPQAEAVDTASNKARAKAIATLPQLTTILLNALNGEQTP